MLPGNLRWGTYVGNSRWKLAIETRDGCLHPLWEMLFDTGRKHHLDSRRGDSPTPQGIRRTIWANVILRGHHSLIFRRDQDV